MGDRNVAITASYEIRCAKNQNRTHNMAVSLLKSQAENIL